MLGDAAILEEVGTVYNKKDAETGVKPVKGVGFPTCISINHCICHNSPIASDADIIVEAGDLVKIDLGVHIDGYIAPCATTFIVGGGEITGRKADALMAAYQASEVALRMMRPGASVSRGALLLSLSLSLPTPCTVRSAPCDVIIYLLLLTSE